MKPTALVTGVSRGIGRSICRQLAKEGYLVHGCYAKSAEDALTLSRELPDVKTYKVDLSDRRQTLDFVAKMKQFRFDAVVNNAGIIEFEDFSQFDYGIWDRTLEVNVSAPLLICHGLRDCLNENAAIVNIASTDGYTGSFSSISYAASKAALLNLTKSLGNLFGERGIRVNAVAPGWINTGMSTEASMDAGTLTPIGRNGRPQEVAEVVSFLLTPKASFINGATIICDGGYTNVDSIMKKEADASRKES